MMMVCLKPVEQVQTDVGELVALQAERLEAWDAYNTEEDEVVEVDEVAERGDDNEEYDRAVGGGFG